MVWSIVLNFLSKYWMYILMALIVSYGYYNYTSTIEDYEQLKREYNKTLQNLSEAERISKENMELYDREKLENKKRLITVEKLHKNNMYLRERTKELQHKADSNKSLNRLLSEFEVELLNELFKRRR